MFYLVIIASFGGSIHAPMNSTTFSWRVLRNVPTWNLNAFNCSSVGFSISMIFTATSPCQWPLNESETTVKQRLIHTGDFCNNFTYDFKSLVYITGNFRRIFMALLKICAAAEAESMQHYHRNCLAESIIKLLYVLCSNAVPSAPATQNRNQIAVKLQQKLSVVCTPP